MLPSILSEEIIGKWIKKGLGEVLEI